MAIVKDKKRNKYYINYKWKTPSGEWKSENIKNKDWIIEGKGKVGIRYMQSIERDEIEKDKAKKQVVWHEGESISLIQLINQFFAVMKSQKMGDETIYSYRLSYKNHLFPIIPETTLAERAFTPTNIDKFRIRLVECGLADKTMNNKLVAVKNLIKYAKKRKYISRDIADDAIDLLEPIKENHRAKVSSNYFQNGEDDFRKFIDTFKEVDNEWTIPILTMFYGALRIGEWQAIVKNDCDFNNCTIRINKQINQRGTLQLHTKTGEDRIISLPSQFMAQLKDFIEERMVNDNDYIFSGTRCAYTGRHKVRLLLNKHLELANLPHITIHGLRHSFATRMFDKGYDVKEVQKHLGHSTMGTTMQYYIHYTQSKAKKDLNDLL